MNSEIRITLTCNGRSHSIDMPEHFFTRLERTSIYLTRLIQEAKILGLLDGSEFRFDLRRVDKTNPVEDKKIV